MRGRVSVFGFGVSGVGFRVSGLGCRDLVEYQIGRGVRPSGVQQQRWLRDWGFGFGVQGLVLKRNRTGPRRVRVSGSRLRGGGFSI